MMDENKLSTLLPQRKAQRSRFAVGEEIAYLVLPDLKTRSHGRSRSLHPPRADPSQPFGLLLAPYAADPARSRGRYATEPSSTSRSVYQRDRDRIIHATAFRRLALKTQVFLPDEGDHFRTRLTHTIEVAQITRTLTRALGLNDDLGEALALAHDLGHTPFGHTGEDALEEALAPFGGFDHNAQTVRIVTALERRYPAFPGLNLTWETLDGLIRRNGRDVAAADRWNRQDLPGFADGDDWAASFAAPSRASGEAQAAALADDIAYNAHDLEDGLQAGLFGLDDLDAIPVLSRTKASLLERTPGLADDLTIRGLARELVGLFVDDAIAESVARLAAVRPAAADDVRAADREIVALSTDRAADSDAIKQFLFARMYRHPRLVDVRSRAKRVVHDLATRLLGDPGALPPEWKAGAVDTSDRARHARRVADYIAGMTDRYAVAEHRRLFDATPELR